MARELALGALASLAIAPRIRAAMWEDAQVRGALLAAAAAGQPCGARELALRAFASLTKAASNLAAMWKDAQVRGVLLAAAAAGQPDGARKWALIALGDRASVQQSSKAVVPSLRPNVWLGLGE